MFVETLVEFKLYRLNETNGGDKTFQDITIPIAERVFPNSNVFPSSGNSFGGDGGFDGKIISEDGKTRKHSFSCKTTEINNFHYFPPPFCSIIPHLPVKYKHFLYNRIPIPFPNSSSPFKSTKDPPNHNHQCNPLRHTIHNPIPMPLRPVTPKPSKQIPQILNHLWSNSPPDKKMTSQLGKSSSVATRLPLKGKGSFEALLSRAARMRSIQRTVP